MRPHDPLGGTASPTRSPRSPVTADGARTGHHSGIPGSPPAPGAGGGGDAGASELRVPPTIISPRLGTVGRGDMLRELVAAPNASRRGATDPTTARVRLVPVPRTSTVCGTRHPRRLPVPCRLAARTGRSARCVAVLHAVGVPDHEPAAGGRRVFGACAARPLLVPPAPASAPRRPVRRRARGRVRTERGRDPAARALPGDVAGALGDVANWRFLLHGDLYGDGVRGAVTAAALLVAGDRRAVLFGLPAPGRAPGGPGREPASLGRRARRVGAGVDGRDPRVAGRPDHEPRVLRHRHRAFEILAARSGGGGRHAAARGPGPPAGSDRAVGDGGRRDRRAVGHPGRTITLSSTAVACGWSPGCRWCWCWPRSTAAGAGGGWPGGRCGRSAS